MARGALVLSLTGGLLAGVSVGAASAQVSRTGTPIAELAVLSVNAMKGRVAPGTPQAGVASLLPPPAVQPGAGMNQPPAASPGGWSSVVVDTGSVLPPAAVAAPPAPAVVSDGSDPRARYPQYRLQLAQEVAARSGQNAAALDAVWARTDERRLTAVFTALAQTGTYYRAGGTDPNGFDCSGLTSYAWAAAGVKLPRISGDQINAIAPRSQDQLQPGDLVWRPGHIAMYIGIGDIVVDSPQTGKVVNVKRWGSVSRFGSPV